MELKQRRRPDNACFRFVHAVHSFEASAVHTGKGRYGDRGEVASR